MISERRIYEVGYKLVFTGCAGVYEADKVKEPIDISADLKKVWEEMGRDVRKMDPSDWELELYCLKCGEFVYLDEENKANFNCECTTESPDQLLR